MATQITQVDHPDRGQTILRIEGDMLAEDAHLIEKIARTASAETGHKITIDLADLDYMDSEAASVLKSLDDAEGFEIDGVASFLQSAVDMAERVRGT